MPGSLLIASDALSERSDLSTRSLDSKIGGKRVSFNKAVRVKQYPWTPDVPDVQSGDHLTLPNSRFWFKVYKSRQEPSAVNQWKQPEEPVSWEEENMECIHDSLAPIAEDEDQDLETDKSPVDSTFTDRFGRRTNSTLPSASQGVRPTNGGLRNGQQHVNGHPTDPPIDYFDEKNVFKDKNWINSNDKPSWATTPTNGERKSFNDKPFYRHEQESSDSWRRENGVTPARKQWNDYNQRSPATRDISIENIKLPRMFIRDDSPRKQIENRWNVASSLKPRERRSRSHDDIIDCESHARSFHKADKSVSTEDLNSNYEDNSDSSPYRLFKRSRDIATQCYGTLSKNKAQESSLGNLSAPLFTRTTFNSSDMNGGTSSVNDTKTSRLNFNQSATKNYSTPSTRYLYRNSSDQSNDNSRVTPKFSNGRASSVLSSTGKNFSFNYRKNEPPTGKTTTGSKNATVGDDSTTYDYVHKLVGVVTKAGYPSREPRSTQQSRSESPKGKGNNRNPDLRPMATVGYVRGRQISLNEANPNSIRKVSSKNESNRYKPPISLPKTGRGLTSITNRSTNDKYDSITTTEPTTKKYLSSNFELNNGRNYNLRNSQSPTKNGSSGFADDTQSMIDWSLSGFQLGTHPENKITSISDSECTVHRRPPLLMYIPGVSHHDRPAVEDDRLSAMSDMSRSELNDDISPLASSHGMDRGFQSDIRRRHSMPRDGKLKWIKWKNSGQR